MIIQPKNIYNMKKIVYLCAASLMFAACGGGQQQSNQSQTQEQPKKEEVKVAKIFKTFPWDFPEGIKTPGLEAGCHVLVPSIVYSTTENLAEEAYVFVEETIKNVGDKASTFAGDTCDVEMPNSLIIPLAKNQTAQVGDVLLTWWQSGWGSQRAIVTDATDPARPKVAYLDLVWDEESSSSAQKNMDQQLEAGTFTVLKSKEWQPGQNVVFKIDGKDEIFEIINLNDSKILGLRYDGKIHVLDRSQCSIIPTDQQLKASDKVKVRGLGTLDDNQKLTKVDAKIGRVWYNDGWSETCRTILEVVK